VIIRTIASSVGASKIIVFTTRIFAQNIVIGGNPPMLLTTSKEAQKGKFIAVLLFFIMFNALSVTSSVDL